jgi:hypothetical protein
LKLRMAPIAPRLATKHGSGEQTLAPESDESSRVQVTGMNGPEPHCVRFHSYLTSLASSDRIGQLSRKTRSRRGFRAIIYAHDKTPLELQVIDRGATVQNVAEALQNLEDET